MAKNKSIPQGYMTVGEIAKKMGVTVRTLQYYDKEGLLSPSAESEGGFRLYTDKDMIQLHQILSMKYVGFSLSDIKKRNTSLDTPDDVEKALAEQETAIEEKLETLSESLKAIKALKAEVVQMQSVDFQKYAAIIMNIRLGNEFYGMVKHFDNETLDDLSKRFNQNQAKTIIKDVNQLLDTAIRYKKDGIPPDSEQGQALVKEFWEMTVETMGDTNEVLRLAQKVEKDGGMSEKQILANEFLTPALGVYFKKNNYNPFAESEGNI
jgi:DNA-binding transcriptional MerR regulator